MWHRRLHIEWQHGPLTLVVHVSGDVYRAPEQVDGDGAEVCVLLQWKLALVQFLRLRVVDLQYGCLCCHAPRTVRVSPSRTGVHYDQLAPNTGHQTMSSDRGQKCTGTSIRGCGAYLTFVRVYVIIIANRYLGTNIN